jgi:hypothetical protein
MSADNQSNLRLALSRRYEGDQQGFLVAEAKLILRRKLPGVLSDAHIEALIVANRDVLTIGRKVDLDALPF